MTASYDWSKLDNAARLFSAVSDVTSTNVFRFSALLYEEVSAEFLQKALEQSLDDLPYFKMRLHKGIFWYYFEPNTEKPLVREEYSYPCARIDKNTNNGYLFDLTYYGKYIHLDCFHALCDGTGATEFLKKIVANYMTIAHSDEVPESVRAVPDTTYSSEQNEDSFLRFKNSTDVKGKSFIRKRAYNLSSILTQNGEIRVTKGIMSVQKLKEYAKSKNVSITAVLTGVLIYSLYKEGFRYDPKKRPLDVCIPVNLRKFFKSETIRNFFSTIDVRIDFYKQEHTLDEIIAIAAEQMAAEMTPEKIYPKIMYGVNAQENIFARFVPLFLKQIILKITYDLGETGQTTAFSNLGVFKVAPEIEQYIDRFEVLLNPTLKSRYKETCCSFNDKFVFAFTTNAESTNIQCRFFKTLREIGIDAVISSNDHNAVAEIPNADKLKNPKKVKKAKEKIRKKEANANEILQKL